MEAVFLNQHEARAYVESIGDKTARLLTEAALSKAIGVWIRDSGAQLALAERPIDLLMFVKALHAFFQDKVVIERILSGKYSNLDDVTDAF